MLALTSLYTCGLLLAPVEVSMPIAAQRPAIESATRLSSVFPPTTTLTADALDDFAVQEEARMAGIMAKVCALMINTHLPCRS